jgi:glutathione peroxidase
MSSIYDFKVKSIDGEDLSLGEYKGKVLLIVNTASKCGFTPQYEGLNALYKELKGQGLVVLGFPCNQFGQQEPGSDAEIADFCDMNFKIEFPLFSKIDVNGPNEAPLYKFLKNEAPGVLGTEAIKWNFTKFLIDRNGKVAERFAPQEKPQNLMPAIKKLL